MWWKWRALLKFPRTKLVVFDEAKELCRAVAVEAHCSGVMCVRGRVE